MPRTRAALALAAAVAASVCTVAFAGDNGQNFTTIERGRYLTVAGDCAACHTAKSGQPFAGGKPIETPFGNVVATNVTPDRETGIGTWSDDDFVRALTLGIRRDGAHLYPAMPYPYFTKMKRDDALAIRAYLATVQPVRYRVTADQLPFPLSVRADMAAWNKLNFSPGTFKPDPGKDAVWNRGAYLVEGPMHCGACHTPKGVTGGDKTTEALQGGAVQGWFAPDITNDARRGIGSWSADEIVAYLKTGHNQTSAATGPMSEVVADSTSKLTDADLHAVATYLKDQPGRNDKPPQPVAADGPAMEIGAAVYADECSACHAAQGAGVPSMFPKLAGSPQVQSEDATSLIRVVLSGAQSAATDAAPTAAGMPAFGWMLDDREAAAVLTYIRNSWGNAAAPVTPDDVAKRRNILVKDSE